MLLILSRMGQASEMVHKQLCIGTQFVSIGLRVTENQPPINPHDADKVPTSARRFADDVMPIRNPRRADVLPMTSSDPIPTEGRRLADDVIRSETLRGPMGGRRSANTTPTPFRSLFDRRADNKIAVGPTNARRSCDTWVISFQQCTMLTH